MAPLDLAQYRALVERTPAMIWRAGIDAKCNYFNATWLAFTGRTLEQEVGDGWTEGVHPDDVRAYLAIYLDHFERRQPFETEYRLRRFDGVYRYICDRGVPYDDDAGSFGGFLGSCVDVDDHHRATARDVAALKLAEERLSEAKELHEKLQRRLIFADRMASVGALAAGVAHEINNPLAYVTANIVLLIEQLTTPTTKSSSEHLTELREMAAEAQTGAQRIRKIVGALKIFSRTEEERRAVIDVRPLLELSINMTFNEIRHRARLEKDYGEIPLVEADDARLGQVFINLLINATQAIKKGDASANEIRIVTSTDARGRAVIEVRDTGEGIPAEMIHRVFDPFFTTKPVGIGTGLGLSICHTIVTGLGGEITVMSEDGRGTTFRIVLPAAVAVPEEAAASATPPNAVVCASVLVVDDEPSIGNALRRVLRDHEVTVVTTAKQALECLGSGKHFDVIFSDLMMPEMSGMDFYDEVARRFPDTASRLVFVSGGAFTAEARAFLDRIANEHIEKPFHAQSVREIVQRYVK